MISLEVFKLCLISEPNDCGPNTNDGLIVDNENLTLSLDFIKSQAAFSANFWIHDIH